MRNALLPILMGASMSIGVSRADSLPGILPYDLAATPQGRVAEARWEKFATQNARAGDLRLQLLFGRTSIPLDQLVERARGSTDPFVLSALSERCEHAKQPAAVPEGVATVAASGGCDAVEFAQRWVAADTQNQLAWLTLATRLDDRGDSSGARNAVEHAARASAYRVRYGEAARAILRILPRDLNDVERLAFAYGIIMIESLEPFPTFQVLFRLCRLPEMRNDCVRIADVMFRDSETLVELFTATALSSRLGIDAETERHRTQRSLAMRWIIGQDVSLHEPSADDSAAIKEFIRETEGRASLGELAWFREALRQRGVSEAEASMRFEKSMTQERKLR